MHTQKKLLKSRQLLGAPKQLRGFGLLQVLLLIAVMAGLAAIGYLQWRERSLISESRQEQQMLAQADLALATFAAVMNRLPCIDTNRDGLEDCDALNVQKGWLPSITLRLAGANSGVNVGQLLYLVQRGGGANNLTAITDIWQPLGYDEDDQTFFAMRGDGYPNDIFSLTDFCQRLEVARAQPISSNSAQVNTSPARAVAYALAHPGFSDADGDGSLFDGGNVATNLHSMEDPQYRPQLAGYNDVVRERSFESLQADLQCAPLINSIDTVALGHDVVAQVADLQEDNIKSAKRAVAFSVLATAMTALEVGLAIAEAVSDGATAGLEWGVCAASLGLAVNFCAAAPQHTVASTLVAGLVAANSLAAVANGVAAGIAGHALELADNDATPGEICPPPDLAVLNQSLVNATAAVAEADRELQNVSNAIRDKEAELSQAEGDKNRAVDELRSIVRSGGTSTSIDAYINDILTQADGWGAASFSLMQARANLETAEQKHSEWEREFNRYNAMLAGSTVSIADMFALSNAISALDRQIVQSPPPPDLSDLINDRALKKAALQPSLDELSISFLPQISRLNQEIVDLENLIASTTDLAQKKLLEESLSARKSDLILIKDPILFVTAIGSTLTELNNAQVELNSQQVIFLATQSAFSTSEQNYRNAYVSLANAAARYRINDADGNLLRYGCTTDCQYGDVNIYLSLTVKLVELFGSQFQNEPSTDAKYLKPLKIQKEIEFLELRRTAAEDRKINAIDMRDGIDRMINAPFPCNLTGSTVIPMKPDQAEQILIEVDRKGGMR